MIGVPRRRLIVVSAMRCDAMHYTFILYVCEIEYSYDDTLYLRVTDACRNVEVGPWTVGTQRASCICNILYYYYYYMKKQVIITK